jgi:predicted ferric reductase
VATKEEVAEEAVPPSQRARHVVLAGVLGAAAVVEFLFVTAGSGKNAILTVAKFFGLHAALLLIVQLTLAARLPWLDHRIGMDRLTVWHRWTGFALFWVIVTHALLILMGYAALYDMSIGATFLSLATRPR